MRKIFRQIIVYPFVLIIICLAGNLFAAESILPANIVIQDTYMPGFGQPVAEIQIVQGKVIIVHDQILHGYPAKEGVLLYKKDTLFCMESSRTSLKFNDGSIISLGSQTSMVIKESIYDINKKNRATFLKMNRGKGRFGVSKLSDFKKSDFKIKTSTAIIGVRGSDFIIRANKLLTEVITLKDTLLEIVNLMIPDIIPTVLSDFERTIVEADALTPLVEKITQEEAEEMEEEFLFIKQDLTNIQVNKNNDYAQESSNKDKDSSLSNSTDGSNNTDEYEIKIPDYELILPDESIDISSQIKTDNDKDNTTGSSSSFGENENDIIEDISEYIHENNIKEEMPSLPKKPAG